jgi:hypothetical protein
MKHTLSFVIMGIAMSTTPLLAAPDCTKLAASVKVVLQNTPERSLEVVAREVAAAPGCACEIVKAAIAATQADADLVAMIVEAAATAAPEQMRLIAQCAIAAAPDSIIGVQAVLAKLDPNSGASIGNPLDFPGAGDPANTVGPSSGLTGGAIPGGTIGADTIFPGVPPFFFPTNPVIPPVETPVSP